MGFVSDAAGNQMSEGVNPIKLELTCIPYNVCPGRTRDS